MVEIRTNRVLANPKTKIKLENYEISYKDCAKNYVSQTNRRINVRSEH